MFSNLTGVFSSHMLSLWHPLSLSLSLSLTHTHTHIFLFFIYCYVFEEKKGVQCVEVTAQSHKPSFMSHSSSFSALFQVWSHTNDILSLSHTHTHTHTHIHTHRHTHSHTLTHKHTHIHTHTHSHTLTHTHSHTHTHTHTHTQTTRPILRIIMRNMERDKERNGGDWKMDKSADFFDTAFTKKEITSKDKNGNIFLFLVSNNEWRHLVTQYPLLSQTPRLQNSCQGGNPIK